MSVKKFVLFGTTLYIHASFILRLDLSKVMVRIVVSQLLWRRSGCFGAGHTSTGLTF